VDNVIKGISILISFGLLLVSYLSFGSWATCGRKEQRFSAGWALLTGFFTYYLAFQVVAVPLMFLQAPLHLLTGIWLAVLLLVDTGACLKFRKQWIETWKGIWKRSNFCHWYDWVPIAIVVFSVLFVTCIHRTYWDATYYVGSVSYAVYYDTINTIEPTTGEVLAQFDMKHCLATYHMNDAVFCQVWRIHPLIQTKTVMTLIITLLHCLAYYMMARTIWNGEKKSMACFLLLAALVFVFSFSDYTVSAFMMFRTYEGKAITAGLVMTMLFLLFIRLWRDFESTYAWRLLFLVAWGAVAVSSSAMILVPAAITVYVLSQWAVRRRIQMAGYYLLALLPCAAVFLCYMLNRLGLFSVMIKG